MVVMEVVEPALLTTAVYNFSIPTVFFFKKIKEKRGFLRFCEKLIAEGLNTIEKKKELKYEEMENIVKRSFEALSSKDKREVEELSKEMSLEDRKNLLEDLRRVLNELADMLIERSKYKAKTSSSLDSFILYYILSVADTLNQLVDKWENLSNDSEYMEGFAYICIYGFLVLEGFLEDRFKDNEIIKKARSNIEKKLDELEKIAIRYWNSD